MKNFRTFNLAVEFYKQAQKLAINGHLKDQLDRASLSICLNLAEGRQRRTTTDQKRFFNIAFSSLREVHGLLIILDMNESSYWK